MGGCCPHRIIDPEIEADRQLQRKHHEIKDSEERIVKVLLLGPGESGKSTIFKQMQLLYGEEGFSPQSRKDYREIIRMNVVEWIQSLIRAANRFQIPFTSAQEVQAVQFISNLDSLQVSSDLQRLEKSLTTLWGNSPSMNTGSLPLKKAFHARSRTYFGLGDSGDSLLYFLEIIPQICEPNYLPSDMDILRARVKTTSIMEAAFRVGNTRFKFMDVGGQKSERRKWINCFDEVTAILFVVAISSYDQTMYEDETVRRMDDALILWTELCKDAKFKQTPLILFLNKFDLFSEKLKQTPMTKFYPEYKGDTDPESAGNFIREQFLEKTMPGSEFFCHFTNATDTQNVEKVWADCKAIIMLKSLRGSGIGGDLEMD